MHDLHRHLAACDLAVVQGGLTTTMELTASGRPFIYVPLRHHFEQSFHVRHRLDRYGAGRCLDYDQTGPEALAHALAAEIGRPVVPPGRDRRRRPCRRPARRAHLSSPVDFAHVTQHVRQAVLPGEPRPRLQCCSGLLPLA